MEEETETINSQSEGEEEDHDNEDNYGDIVTSQPDEVQEYSDNEGDDDDEDNFINRVVNSQKHRMNDGDDNHDDYDDENENDDNVENNDNEGEYYDNDQNADEDSLGLSMRTSSKEETDENDGIEEQEGNGEWEEEPQVISDRVREKQAINQQSQQSNNTKKRGNLIVEKRQNKSQEYFTDPVNPKKSSTQKTQAKINVEKLSKYDDEEERRNLSNEKQKKNTSSNNKKKINATTTTTTTNKKKSSDKAETATATRKKPSTDNSKNKNNNSNNNSNNKKKKASGTTATKGQNSEHSPLDILSKPKTKTRINLSDYYVVHKGLPAPTGAVAHPELLNSSHAWILYDSKRSQFFRCFVLEKLKAVHYPLPGGLYDSILQYHEYTPDMEDDTMPDTIDYSNPDHVELLEKDITSLADDIAELSLYVKLPKFRDSASDEEENGEEDDDGDNGGEGGSNRQPVPATKLMEEIAKEMRVKHYRETSKLKGQSQEEGNAKMELRDMSGRIFSSVNYYAKRCDEIEVIPPDEAQEREEINTKKKAPPSKPKNTSSSSSSAQNKRKSSDETKDKKANAKQQTENNKRRRKNEESVTPRKQAKKVRIQLDSHSSGTNGGAEHEEAAGEVAVKTLFVGMHRMADALSKGLNFEDCYVTQDEYLKNYKDGSVLFKIIIGIYDELVMVRSRKWNMIAQSFPITFEEKENAKGEGNAPFSAPFSTYFNRDIISGTIDPSKFCSITRQEYLSLLEPDSSSKSNKPHEISRMIISLIDHFDIKAFFFEIGGIGATVTNPHVLHFFGDLRMQHYIQSRDFMQYGRITYKDYRNMIESDHPLVKALASISHKLLPPLATTQ